MKCPYNIDIKQSNCDKYIYDDDGKNVQRNHILKEERTFTECLKENCGAYQDGKCNYRGS